VTVERQREPGEVVVMRHVRGDWLWAAPMRVVEDRGDFVALYLQSGSEVSTMGGPDGQRTRDYVHATKRIRTRWGINHSLQLIRSGDRHATVLYWDEHTWEFRCWYINFQEPLRRIAQGFESMDQTLDLVIAPDRKSWQWKDEEEFAFGIEHGWYSDALLRELKDYGLRVVEDASAGREPFDGGWEDWRPPGPLAAVGAAGRIR
jgi:hypothetical protein